MDRETKVKGISLIVLVITIIIIIILAGAVILSLTNSGIIAKAKLAKESNDLVAIKEAVEAEKSNGMFDGNTASYSSIVPASYSSEIYVMSDGNILIKGVASPKITDIPNALEKLGAVYIPVGFEYLTGTLDEGIVIKNTADGNEFVWVPVPTYSEFVREDFFNANQVSIELVTSIGYDFQFFEKQPTVNGTDEVSLMNTSVSKYKGFYVARYEASNNGNGVIQSLKNKTSWTGISWGGSNGDMAPYDGGNGNDEDPSGMVYKSRTLYDTSTAKTTLMYSVQWDAIMRWFKASGINIQDSTSLGNYATSAPIATGSNESYKTKNIYDLAGNLCEFTMEQEGQYRRAFRGWGYGTNSLCGRYYGADPDWEVLNQTNAIGFRPTMYIK